MIELIPTVVPSSLEDVDVFVARNRSFAQTFHIDAADGIFAPNKTWIPELNETLPQHDTTQYEAHLMVSHPEAVGNVFVMAGAKRIVAHVEAFSSEEEIKRTFNAWRAAGATQIGVALLIDTPLEAFEQFSVLSDCVTLMSIPRIGVQGIPFDERGYGRVADLHARYPDLVIEVDGGVGKEQIATLARAGASRFSVGSAISKSPDPAQTHRELLELAQKAL
jgi:ribulose-phosphate 3-epimerase